MTKSPVSMSLMNTVESSAIESPDCGDISTHRLFIALNVTSQERDNASFVLDASLGISGLKTRYSLEACQYLSLPNYSLT